MDNNIEPQKISSDGVSISVPKTSFSLARVIRTVDIIIGSIIAVPIVLFQILAVVGAMSGDLVISDFATFSYIPLIFLMAYPWSNVFLEIFLRVRKYNRMSLSSAFLITICGIISVMATWFVSTGLHFRGWGW